jgi:hypothetical protein
MRPATEQLRGVLSASFNHYYTADIYYNGERRLADVPLTDVRFNEDGDADLQQSGSFTIVWTDAFGRSVSPREIGDVLAPFGAEVYLYSRVWVGPFVERVALGQFTITDVPSAMDEDMLFRGEWITVGSVVEIEFKERLVKVQDDRFDVPSAATDLDSTWDELGRLTELQLLRTLPDKPIPRAVVYEEDRLDAVYNLTDVLDGIPHMTADGALSARPKTWPAPVDTLRRGAKGSVVRVGRAMSPKNVYNRVAFRGKSGDQEIILASAEVNSGPLRARNPDGTPAPYRRKTLFVASEYVTNAQQAVEYVNRELPRVSKLRSIRVPITETFNPLRERGDVVVVQRAKETMLGRIVSIDRDQGPTQEIVVEVADG